MKRFLSIILVAIVATAIIAQETKPNNVVTISARRFEFTPNQITLKKGEAVTLRVTAEDRDHGFLQEDLGVDLDLQPGKVSEITITPQSAGRLVAICDDFCGSGHGNMKLVINVVE